MLKTGWENAAYPLKPLPVVVIWDGSQAAISDREGCARFCLENADDKMGPCIGFNYPDSNRKSFTCKPEYGDVIEHGVKDEMWQYYMLVDRNPVCIDIGNLIFKFYITKVCPLKHIA